MSRHCEFISNEIVAKDSHWLPLFALANQDKASMIYDFEVVHHVFFFALCEISQAMRNIEHTAFQ